MASKKVPTPIVPLDPNILKLYQRGLHAYDQGKFEQAAEALKQVVKTDPNNTTYLYELARACFFVDKKQGKKLCKQIMSLQQICPFTWYLLAQIYEQTNKANKAIQYYFKVFDDRSDTSHLSILNRINAALQASTLYEQMGQVQMAEQLLLKASAELTLRSVPEFADILQHLARVMHHETHNPKALQIYEFALNMYPNLIGIYINFGAYCEEVIHDIDKAEQIYVQALSKMPDADCYFNYGSLLENHRRDYYKAKQMYTSSLQLKPDDDEAKAGLQRMNMAIAQMAQQQQQHHMMHQAKTMQQQQAAVAAVKPISNGHTNHMQLAPPSPLVQQQQHFPSTSSSASIIMAADNRPLIHIFCTQCGQAYGEMQQQQTHCTRCNAQRGFYLPSQYLSSMQ